MERYPQPYTSSQTCETSSNFKVKAVHLTLCFTGFQVVDGLLGVCVSRMGFTQQVM